jgi:hypothetical protein
MLTMPPHVSVLDRGDSVVTVRSGMRNQACGPHESTTP